jgi:probable rRNA maturation factor
VYTAVHEDFEGASNAIMASAIVLHQPVKVVIQRISNQAGIPTDYKLRKWARAALAGRPADAEITIRITGEKEAAALNKKWRGKNGATNVLSFPLAGNQNSSSGLLGDIIICAPVVRREAKIQNKSEEAHWAHMVIHGILHLSGYDHIKPKEAAAMEKLEIRLLKKLGYKNPYHDQS